MEGYILNGVWTLIKGEEEEGMGKPSSWNLAGRSINKETLCKHETNFGSHGYPVSSPGGLHSNHSAQTGARSAPSTGRLAHNRPRYLAKPSSKPGPFSSLRSRSRWLEGPGWNPGEGCESEGDGKANGCREPGEGREPP